MDEEREVTIGWLARSLAQGTVDALRHNKLAAVLAAITLTVLSALAFDNRFDSQAEYQQSVVPRLLRLENGFQASLQMADNRDASEEWRRYFFENAHSQVRDVLRAARLDRPASYVATRKHREFIRYYDMVESEFHAIGMKMTVNPNLDYVAALKAKMEELKPIRARWADWAL